MILTVTRRRLLPLLALAPLLCLSGMTGVKADPARHPAKEDTYTITSILRVLPPADPAAMSDDFQDVRVLARDKDSATVEVTYYPLYRQPVGEDPDWRKDDAGMTAFLQPTPAENWDAAMRRALVAQLKQDGISPDALTDKALVERVSRWAMNRAQTTDAFAIWDVYYPGGKPTVFPALRAAFDQYKPDSSWTDQQMFDREALGKSMFYGKVHGSCTSSSIYLTTIFRALGIPTRTVICIPPFDPNDDAQAAKFYAAVHDNKVRETVRAGMDGVYGFDNHLFNEVYVGHHWVRLNYDRLGQPILDSYYYGLLTHIATSADLSKTPLAQTWGVRYAGLDTGQPKLSSVNPYMLLSVSDHFGANAHLENPPVPVAELRSVTVSGLFLKDSPALPKFVLDASAGDTSFDFFVAIKEQVPGAAFPMRAFLKRASHGFVLAAPGHPDVRAALTGLNDNAGDFEGFGARIAPEDKAKLVPGVAYTITPQNTSDVYHWSVAPGVTLTLPAR